MKNRKPAKYLVTIPQKLVEEPIIHKLSTEFKVIPNIMRGRITAESARLEVEFSGSQKQIARATKYLASKSIKVKKI